MLHPQPSIMQDAKYGDIDQHEECGNQRLLPMRADRQTQDADEHEEGECGDRGSVPADQIKLLQRSALVRRNMFVQTLKLHAEILPSSQMLIFLHLYAYLPGDPYAS